jgi:hypothetical protein
MNNNPNNSIIDPIDHIVVPIGNINQTDKFDLDQLTMYYNEYNNIVNKYNEYINKNVNKNITTKNIGQIKKKNIKSTKNKLYSQKELLNKKKLYIDPNFINELDIFEKILTNLKDIESSINNTDFISDIKTEFESDNQLVNLTNNDIINRRIKEEEYNETKKTYNHYYNLYFDDKTYINNKIHNYNNLEFCHYCNTHQVIPIGELPNFMYMHLINNKNPRYLKILYRIHPEYFLGIDITKNKHLKSIIQNEFGSIASSEEVNSPNFNKYINNYSFSFDRTFRFEINFHQENLTFCDYIKCNLCHGYLCPMHIYLTNFHNAKCNICGIKSWNVCGWCKPMFNEYWACKILHNIEITKMQ